MHAEVCFLLRLYFIDKYKIVLDGFLNLLCRLSLQLFNHVSRRKGHLYLDWAKSSHAPFIKSDIFKMHRQFSHPSNESLLNLLELLRSHERNPNTLETLQQIKHACDTCQRLCRTLLRFKVSILAIENVNFGGNLSTKLFILGCKAVLHIIDTATRLSAAAFFDASGAICGNSVDIICFAFQ